MALHLDRNQEATVWVGGLDLEVDEDILWELMLQSGPIASVNMPRDKITGDHAGYAFVEFSSEQDADYAMKIMNMVRIFGKAIKINKAARDRKEMDVGANIFVGNLEEEVDDQLLYNAFSVFGQVLAAKVMFDADGKHRGFGFVNFADFSAADMSIQHMSGQFLCNRAIHVSYAYKEGHKGERHGSYEERYLAKRQAAKYAKPVNMLFGTTVSNSKQSYNKNNQISNLPITHQMGLTSQSILNRQNNISKIVNPKMIIQNIKPSMKLNMIHQLNIKNSKISFKSQKESIKSQQSDNLHSFSENQGKLHSQTKYLSKKQFPSSSQKYPQISIHHPESNLDQYTNSQVY